MPFKNGGSSVQKKRIQTVVFFIFLYINENESIII
jgi:hypothetical protein